ncbi:MAG: hypothetical protein IPL84_00500 [Chitinophagaceae bacterium]|nr:hypothetical protein [Chitinophagaceae bacterium]
MGIGISNVHFIPAGGDTDQGIEYFVPVGGDTDQGVGGLVPPMYISFRLVETPTRA